MQESICKMNIADDRFKRAYGGLWILADRTRNFEYYAYVNKIDVFYFDDSGKKHFVNVTEVKDKSKCKCGND